MAERIDELTVPALFVLCSDATKLSEEQIARRKVLAAWLEERGHLDFEWLAAGHLLVASHPEETAGFKNNFAARATRA